MNILHILRAPIGGLFRHARDLAEQQVAMGHNVGFVTAIPADSPYVAKTFADIEPKLSFGIHKLNISRMPSLLDFKNLTAISQIVIDNDIDIIHGHGAKGGAYTRLIKKRHLKTATSAPKTFYTLHGGTLHYSPKSPVGFVFLKLEKYLQKYTDGFIFESKKSQQVFEIKIDKLYKPFKTIHNGLKASEFYQTKLAVDAADFLYIGELRMLKGVDLLIDAFAKLCHAKVIKRQLTLIIIGYGPDAKKFKQQVAKLNIAANVVFMPPMPAGEAFKLAKVQVMPSRAEGLPYMILETIAAKMPLIAANVGGIPEIYAEHTDLLFEPEDTGQLFDYMRATIVPKRRSIHLENVDILQKSIQKSFNVEDMAAQITQFYDQV
ncbi:MAG: glycosyltransferase family 4 protein [Rhizobiales bacterium]|nr:glycosyltransferase family 4 protein [Hyphomicrobiales bacterium]NRB14757.1 glycosyltransferase family 4 protein [Hyphomicrobiales bacterium]